MNVFMMFFICVWFLKLFVILDYKFLFDFKNIWKLFVFLYWFKIFSIVVIKLIRGICIKKVSKIFLVIYFYSCDRVEYLFIIKKC